MRTIDIDGEPIVLEERVCAGGCGKVFACMPSSLARYARAYCNVACFGESKTREQRRASGSLRAPLPSRLVRARGGSKPITLLPIRPADPWESPSPRAARE